jgi:hypothetical protein
MNRKMWKVSFGATEGHFESTHIVIAQTAEAAMHKATTKSIRDWPGQVMSKIMKVELIGVES